MIWPFNLPHDLWPDFTFGHVYTRVGTHNDYYGHGVYELDQYSNRVPTLQDFGQQSHELTKLFPDTTFGGQCLCFWVNIPSDSNFWSNISCEWCKIMR